MTQDIPRHDGPDKQPRREATAKAPVQQVAQQAEAPPRKLRRVSTDAPEAGAAESLITPTRIEPPAPRPSEMTTSSIPRPSQPVGPTAATGKVYTTSRVRLRQKADLSATVVTTLSRGQELSELSRKGKWHLVSIGGKKGWVHGDFLTAAAPRSDVATASAAPRPKQIVARAEPASRRQEPEPVVQRKTEPVAVVDATVSSSWGGLRPARAPQGGDCQCPYDLMLNGKQCGEHSAYARRTSQVQCYF